MTANRGMGAIMTYDLRIHTQRYPLPVLQRMATGAYAGTVTRDAIPANGYTKDWQSGGPGVTITWADIQ